MSPPANYALAGAAGERIREISGTLGLQLGRPGAGTLVASGRVPWLMNVLVVACLPSEESSFQMSKSVDSFWLMSAMTYGIPGCFLIATACVAPFLWPAERERPDVYHEISSQSARTTLGIIMVCVVVVGFTVYFWGAIWMLISIIVALRTHLGSDPQASVLS